MTMDYSPWSEREIWPFLNLVAFFDISWSERETVFEGGNISETRMAPPTKIGVHAFDIKLHLHDFFELIPID